MSDFDALVASATRILESQPRRTMAFASLCTTLHEELGKERCREAVKEAGGGAVKCFQAHPHFHMQQSVGGDHTITLICAEWQTVGSSKQHGKRAEAAPKPAWWLHDKNKRKTQLCKHFPLGKCTFGSACAFAHGVKELATSTSTTAAEPVSQMPTDWQPAELGLTEAADPVVRTLNTILFSDSERAVDLVMRHSTLGMLYVRTEMVKLERRAEAAEARVAQLEDELRRERERNQRLQLANEQLEERRLLASLLETAGRPIESE
tara:strand:- start:171 stop:962 length:792 start_codon:yes stop_codon:yes gene_type:complete